MAKAYLIDDGYLYVGDEVKHYPIPDNASPIDPTVLEKYLRESGSNPHSHNVLYMSPFGRTVILYLTCILWLPLPLSLLTGDFYNAIKSIPFFIIGVLWVVAYWNGV